MYRSLELLMDHKRINHGFSGEIVQNKVEDEKSDSKEMGADGSEEEESEDESVSSKRSHSLSSKKSNEVNGASKRRADSTSGRVPSKGGRGAKRRRNI